MQLLQLKEALAKVATDSEDMLVRLGDRSECTEKANAVGDGNVIGSELLLLWVIQTNALRLHLLVLIVIASNKEWRQC